METIAIIGFVLTVMGTIESGLFMYNTLAGLGGADAINAPKQWGKPWSFWLQPGMNGAYNESDDGSQVLKGAGGPLPQIHIFNRVGEYLGAPRNNNYYARQNTWKQIPVYPRSVSKHEGQDAQFVILAAKPHDPLCIADLGLGLPEGGQFAAGPWAFSSFTAQACGAPWYHSGILRDSEDSPSGTLAIPCFWLGAYGLLGMQIHLPSHSVKAATPLKKINVTAETIHDYACNHPAVLDFWSELPPAGKIPRSLITDLKKKGDKTLNETLELRNRTEIPGDEIHAQSTIDYLLHAGTITISHVDQHGLSATALCEDGMSRGPDYVNIPEGKFCSMYGKKLWPTCNHDFPDGPKDNCFNVDTRQLVIGGKVKRSEPYKREVHYPLVD